MPSLSAHSLVNASYSGSRSRFILNEAEVLRFERARISDALAKVNGKVTHAAELLGMKDQVGSIEVGKFADLVAVDGDPLKDPKVFGKVVFVMKNGDVYKQ